MFKNLVTRLIGLAVAAISFAPAMVAFVSVIPFDLIYACRAFYHPLWWWKWVGSRMPIPRPWHSASDVLWSIPAALAVAGVAGGFAIAIHRDDQGGRGWRDGS